MQVHEKPRGLDDSASKRVVIDPYWARRLPRTAAKGRLIIEEAKKKNYVEQRVEDTERTKIILSGYAEVKIVKRTTAQDRRAQKIYLTEAIRCERRRKIRDIVVAASYVSGYSVNAILGTSREHELTQIRSVISRIARGLLYSFPEIGRALGDRHHSTIMHIAKETALTKKSWKMMERISWILKTGGNLAYDNKTKV